MNKIKIDWHHKTFIEWLNMFPQDTSIDIYSYGCWCLLPWTIDGFIKGLKEEQESIYPDNTYRCISQSIVKKIYQDPSDHERLIFDVQGNTVHLWNKIMMENKDPDREMMAGLRVPLKDGIDPLRIFTERKVQWSSQPFYIDEFAISRLMNKECLK